MIGWPYFYPYYWGGVGVQPMLSDDCPTIEQQIMLLNYRVKKLEAGGDPEDLTELKAKVAALEAQMGDVNASITNLTANITAVADAVVKLTPIYRSSPFTYTYVETEEVTLTPKDFNLTGLKPSTTYRIEARVSPQTIVGGETLTVEWIPIQPTAITTDEAGEATARVAVAGYTKHTAPFNHNITIDLTLLPA